MPFGSRYSSARHDYVNFGFDRADVIVAVGYELQESTRSASIPAVIPRSSLRTALAADTVSVIACPVDYTANLELIESLGDLDESLS